MEILTLVILIQLKVKFYLEEILNQFVKEYTYSLPTGSLNIYSNYVDFNLRSTDKFTSSLKLKLPTLKSSLITSVKTNEYKDKLKTKWIAFLLVIIMTSY